MDGAAHSGGHAQPQADGDDMHTVWQYLDSTLGSGSTPNGLPPTQQQPPPLPPQQQQQQFVQQQQRMAMATGAMPAASAEGDAVPLTDDDNGMYNELGDVFNMFFNLDSDDSNGQQHQHQQQQQQQQAMVMASAQALDASSKVQLSRHASSSSFGDGISPGMGVGYPSMSPATMNWLQSLSKSPSSESLSGLISPATMSFSGSAGGLSVNESGSAQGGLPRSPSMEMIDWKAYNDAVGIAEKAQKEPAKWRVIPQHGPHAEGDGSTVVSGQAYNSAPASTATGMVKPPPASTGVPEAPRSLFTRQFQTIKSTVVSLVGALSAGETTATPASATPAAQAASYQTMQPTTQTHQPQAQAGIVMPSEVQQQYELATQRMADEKNKRKAIISPEYVQYSSAPSSQSAAAVAAMAASSTMADPIKYEAHAPAYANVAGPVGGQYATQVQDPTGRRPAKKTLHQAEETLISSSSAALTSVKEEAFPGGGPVRCKCTGKCRNARCACVKAGFVCGVHCKCVSCANPFVPMEKAGIDIQKMVDDVCLMQFLSKVKDMEELLDSTVSYDCCGGSVQVKETVEHGFTCPKCQAHYTYSWCSNRLCHDQKKPRKHCAKCRRCGDHRNEHCDDCNHCYFAGVANSFSCSCKGGKNGAGGSSGGKSRSVVPNVGGHDDSTSPTNGSGGHHPQDRRSDENENPQNAKAGNASNMAAGLSNSEAEKDDACPVQ